MACSRRGCSATPYQGASIQHNCEPGTNRFRTFHTTRKKFHTFFHLIVLFRASRPVLEDGLRRPSLGFRSSFSLHHRFGFFQHRFFPVLMATLSIYMLLFLNCRWTIIWHHISPPLFLGSVRTRLLYALPLSLQTPGPVSASFLVAR